jgi:hypothetical protein
VLESLLLTAALSIPADPVHDREWANSRPQRGLHGRYQDSNVREVWEGVPHKVRMVWLCIRRHESMSYTGENPVSTASGAGQWLNSTWDGIKVWVKVNGKFVAKSYDEAKDAPAWIQDAAFLHVYKHKGLSMWHGTWCPGT